MYAVLVQVEIKDRETAEGQLHERVVPGVKQMPGFVAGYWTNKDDTGLSLVVFDSEDNATTASKGVEERLPEGIELKKLEVREVIASA